MKLRDLRGRQGRMRWLGLFAVLAIFALAACGGDDDDSATPPEQSSESPDATAAEFNAQAAVELMSHIPVDQLDPHLNPRYGPLAPMFAIYDRLFILDTETLDVEPMLASSFEFTDDGSALILHLRDDVTFHDGTPFNADAVKANFERAKTLEGSLAAAPLEVVTSIEVVSDTEVRLNVGPGAAALPTLLAGQEGIMISPAALADPARSAALGTDPGLSGSGPYLLRELVPNERFVLELSDDDYWGESAGRAQEIHYSTVVDQQARTTALQTGAANVINVDIDNPETAASIEAEGFDITPYRAFLPAAFLMRPEGEFADIRVRQAIAMAIDKAGINDAFYGGFCEPAEPTTLHNSGSWGNDESAEPALTHDPEAARRLLEEADATGMSFKIPVHPSYQDVATAIQAQLREVGVTTTIDTLEGSEANNQYLAGNYHALAGSIPATADPALTLSNLLSLYQLGGDEGAVELRPIITEGLDQSASQEKRAEAVHEANKILEENAYVVPLCHRPFVMGSDEVIGTDQMYWPAGYDFRVLAVRS